MKNRDKQPNDSHGIEIDHVFPLNKIVRPFTTKWHGLSLGGAFDDKELVKIGAKVVSHARYVTFQMAEVLVSRSLFYELLERIHLLKPVPITSGSG